MAPSGWSARWSGIRAGVGCPKCEQGRVDDDGHGLRFHAGTHADAYLQRRAVTPGYATVVFRGRHVADPVELTDDEVLGYWADVRTVGRAIASTFRPLHLNYSVLGNDVPHLHTHVVARYADDPAPLRPLPPEVWDAARTVPADELDAQVRALRRAIAV